MWRSVLVHSSPPWRPWALPRVGEWPGAGLQSPSPWLHDSARKASEWRESERQQNVWRRKDWGFGVRRYSNLSCDKVCQGSCAPSGTAKDNTRTKNGKQRSVIWWAGGGERKTPDAWWECGVEEEQRWGLSSIEFISHWWCTAQRQTLIWRPCGEADMTAGETSGCAGLLCVCTHRPESQRYGFSVAGGTFLVQLLCPRAVHDHTLTDELACWPDPKGPLPCF